MAGIKSTAPISSHPLFPAVVAFWFATLLGLGSFVLPAVLLERAVALSGIDGFVAAAQPPLGFTARLLIALGAAAVGAIAGLAVARRVISAQTAEHFGAAAEWIDDADSKRPISASEELGLSRLEEPVGEEDTPAPDAPVAGRRRPLALEDDKSPGEFFDHAPLPGSAPFAPTAEALDLAVFLAAPDERETSAEPEDAEPRFGRQELVGPWLAEEEARPDEISSPNEPSPENTPMPQPSEPPYEPSFDNGEPARESGLRSRPLGELGLVELVERFASSLQRRTETDAKAESLELPRLRVEDQQLAVPAAGEIPLPAALRPVAIGAAEEEEDEPVLAHAVSGLVTSSGSQDECDARSDKTAPAANENAGDEVGEAVAETFEDDAVDDSARYSSLLAMKPHGAGRGEADSGPLAALPGHRRPASPASDGPSRDPFSQPPRALWGGQQFDLRAAEGERPEALPAAPRAASPNPGDTERALRSALRKLQNVSGAA